MRLKKFEIKSYRSCLNTSFNLDEELTALIGINGAGKSNILNSILLLRKILIKTNFLPSKQQDSLFSNCHIKFELEHEKKTIYVKGEIFYETDERNLDDVQFTILKFNFKEFITNSKWFEIPLEFLSPDILNRRLSGDFNRFSHKERYRFYKLQEQLPRNILPILSKISDFLYGINYYSASQFADPSKCPISIEFDENRPIRKLRNNSLGHEKFILDLYRTSESEKLIYKRYLNTVGLLGLGLIENINFNKVDMPTNTFEIKTGGRIKQIERTRSIVVPNFIVDGINLSPNQLSEGTLKTLALLFYTLTDDSKLLLIEEPEVCIHHGLLNSIISIIKSQAKNKQIIISTHSDYVLDLLKPENIILVKKQKSQGTTAKLLTKSISKNDFKALRNYLSESGNLGEYWKEGGFDND